MGKIKSILLKDSERLALEKDTLIAYIETRK